MSKIHPVLIFLLILIGTLGLSLFLHIWLLRNNGHYIYGDHIVLSYIVNFVLAALIYIFLFSFKLRLKNYIGFLFMFGSFLKFLVFFLIFYPLYKADGEMSRTEFAAFFVPYAICLIIETYFVAKMLQKQK